MGCQPIAGHKQNLEMPGQPTTNQHTRCTSLDWEGTGVPRGSSRSTRRTCKLHTGQGCEGHRAPPAVYKCCSYNVIWWHNYISWRSANLTQISVEKCLARSVCRFSQRPQLGKEKTSGWQSFKNGSDHVDILGSTNFTLFIDLVTTISRRLWSTCPLFQVKIYELSKYTHKTQYIHRRPTLVHRPKTSYSGSKLSAKIENNVVFFSKLYIHSQWTNV